MRQGVKQGCSLSPTLFANYINDLVEDTNQLNCGTDVGDTHISLFLYVDDIVLLSESAEDMQSKKISNDQELIQSDPISCPQNQKGNN